MKNFTFLIIILFAFSFNVFAQDNNVSLLQNDVDPNNVNLTPLNPGNNPLPLYELLRNHNIDSLIGTVYNYGVCWTGTHYVTSRFSTQNMFSKMTSDWVRVDSFAASGAGTGFLRDLTYAKGKIWGSPLTGIVYGINPNTGVCEKTITTSGAQIRAITWDPVRNGFWCGTTNFAGPVRCYDTNGVAISGAAITQTGSYYGIGYDDDPTGPFLWVSTDQTPASPTGVAIIKFNATTLAQIGAPINITTPLTAGAPNLSSGACEVVTNLIPGKRTLVGVVQGTPDRVYVVDLGTLVAVSPISSETPKDYNLSQNYPNPFNPTTNINFALPKTGYVNIKVYNSIGKEIKTLVDGIYKVGTYAIGFDASSLSSGIYFYKIQTEGFTSTKKMMLVK
jgi:hypothetical protein